MNRRSFLKRVGASLLGTVAAVYAPISLRPLLDSEGNFVSGEKIGKGWTVRHVFYRDVEMCPHSLIGLLVNGISEFKPDGIEEVLSELMPVDNPVFGEIR